MTYFEKYTSAQSDWLGILYDIINGGRDVSPRGMPVREMAPAYLVFTNPKRNYIDPINRKMNLPFAILDFADWMLGHNPGTSRLYNSQMDKFLNEDTAYDGAYGPRFFTVNSKGRKYHQVERIVEELKQDKDSRRAVINIFDNTRENFDGKDVACTLTLQFLIRDSKLDLITNMRSEDAYLGMCYDLFGFQLLQMCVASMLKVEVGYNYHNVGSLHIYERDFPKIEKLRTSLALSELPAYAPKVDTFSQFITDLHNISEMSYEVSNGLFTKFLPPSSQYFRDAFAVVDFEARRRHNKISVSPLDVIQNHFKWYFLEGRGKFPVESK